MNLAITGGTGFVGAHLLDAALAAGHQVKALTRRDQDPRDGLEWIAGDLSSRDALEQLVRDVDAIIHVAGTISAPTAAGFEKGNVAGTLAMLAAATAGGVHRFVHVSSLAAREPRLSVYGASKAKAEELVMSSGLDWTIVRPPAVYGPGDRETLELFRMAKLGLMGFDMSRVQFLEPGSVFEAGGRTEGAHIVGDMLRRARAAGIDPGPLRAAWCHLQAAERIRERTSAATTNAAASA